MDELIRRREEALNAGGKAKLEARRAKGLMTARDRIEALFDAGSFQEFGMHVQHNCHNFGMEKKVLPTDGIVSGLEREITLNGKNMTLMQISASVNPGNSGGGVFDQYGNLIGLVVAKSSGSDVEGLGFAIPSNTVASVAESLISNGYVTGRPAAGITIVDLTSASDAMKYGVSVTGVYIQEVTGSNAESAGLKAGDLIYMIDGEQVTGSDMLVQTIQSHEIGDKVTFTIVRDDQMMEIQVTLAEATS